MDMSARATMEYNSKADRIAEQIAVDIRSGKFASGVLLPPDEELARAYSISRVTLRKSLAVLSGRGQIRRLPQGGALAERPVLMDDSASEMPTVKSTQRKLAIAGVLWAPVTSAAWVQRHAGLRQYAEENDISFTSIMLPSHEAVCDLLRRVDDFHLDGLVVNPCLEPGYREALAALAERKFPVVLDRTGFDLPLSTVMSNDIVGGYESAYYVIEKYRRPAYYLVSRKGRVEASERYMGYCNAMRDFGYGHAIEQHMLWVERRPDDPEHHGPQHEYRPDYDPIQRAFSKIRSFPATVIVCNDSSVPDLYEAVHAKGLKVGKDVMIVGFDDLPLASHLSPTLTTVRAEPEALGYEAGKLLHKLINKEVQPPVHVHLPLELIVRESA
jgi:DNA-binding LacI/PurR family transcriptional regulator